MFSFTSSLDNVSNNIANMNTPGFRGTDTFLRSVNGDGSGGLGVSVQGNSVRLASGEVRQTGNATDVAIVGTGLFVLKDEAGEIYYTRGGQFQFDENFVLVDSASGHQVMGMSEENALELIDISELRVLPAIATSEISFSGNLSSTDTEHEVSPITVFDSSGGSHDLTLDFTNPTTSTDTWTVEVSNINGEVLGSGEIRFSVTGAPLEGFNTFETELTLNGESQTVTFHFGEPNTFSSTTQFSGATSTVFANEVNGNGVLGLSAVNIDEEGIFNFTYTNGDEEKGPQLALALFANESDLELTSGNLYQDNSATRPILGRANSNGLGTIQGGSVELSNVDLTQEFADLLITQRGFQASSRVMNVSNELIEELYNSTR